MRKTLLLLSLLIAGCANADFPFCCDQTGVSNVPYTTTYHFEAGSGFVNIGGDTSFLSIVSQADLANLFNAANVSKVPGTGAVGGSVVSIGGSGASGVVLQVTDMNGNQVGDLFYNSLGGIPDFSVTSGTSGSGGFTLLNAPPGEIYFKAVQGGRGNGSVVSFSDSVSVVNISVLPVIQPVVGLTGGVRQYDVDTAITGGGVLLTPVGLQGLDVVSRSDGGYRFPSLGSDSSFLIKGAAAGYWPTYQVVRTDLSSRPEGAVDVTSKIYLLSQSLLSADLTQTKYLVQNPGKGILIGTSRDPDDTPRNYPYLLLTDDTGSLLNFDPVSLKSRIYYHGTYLDPSTKKDIPTFFYYDATGTVVSWFDSAGNLITYDCKQDLVQGQMTQTCPPSMNGRLDGKYIAFDLPPGAVHLSATALEKLDTGFSNFTGEDTADIFSGSATLKDITMTKMDLAKTDVYQRLVGNITTSDGLTPVGFASLFALGNGGSLTTSDVFGYLNIPLSSRIYLDQADYIMKVSKFSYIDTYQAIKTSLAPKSLILYSSAVLNQYLSASGLSGQYDNTKGILTGIVIDNLTGRGTNGVSMKALDLAGNIVGDIRYFDSTGLPSLSQATSKNGGYIIYNLPPGLIQIQVVSQDDSGNSLTHVYPGGIVLNDLHVNNNPPPGIQVSGSTIDLNKTPMGGINLSVRGEKTAWTSASDGTFSQPFPPNSQFMVKARSPQPGGIDTYNLFQTGVAGRNALPLYALTTGTLQTLAAGAGVTLDLTNGVIGGRTTTSGFDSSLPVAGFNTSPLLLPADLSQQKMTAGLFNEDNEVDLAIVNSADNTLTILLGGGDGTFRQSAGSPLCMPRGTVLLSGQTCLTGAQPVAVRSVDLNGDGVADLIVVNKGTDSVTVLLGTKKGNFIPAGQPIPLPAGSRPLALSVADFNNDQKADLIVLNSGSNTFSWIPGNGDGTFSAQIYPYYSGGSSPAAILSRDFNGDGNLDLAIVNSGSSSVSIFLGYGTGNFSPAPQSPLLFPAGASPVGIAADDLDGDGKIDLVVANSGSSSVSVLLGKGGGIFAPPNSSPPSLSGFPRFIAISDINFDGRPDIITSLSSGNISVLSGLGDGTFTPETKYAVGNNPVNLAIADFNDDTFSDLIVYQYASGTLSFLAGTEVALSNVSIAASDLNGLSVGQIAYLNSGGSVIPGGKQTDASGQFLIFNVPPGMKNIHAVQGGSGNRWMTAYPGSATFGNIAVTPPDYRQISYAGRTIDSVGSQAVRFVESVGLSFLGTGLATRSDPVNSTFSINVDANSAFLIKLQR